jgi:MATE family multidrug resistance protein
VSARRAEAQRSQPARFYLPPRWEGHGGLKKLLYVAGPMILSNALHGINGWLDRQFLARYANADFAASTQGGVMMWTLLIIPLGIVGYASAFVAQYHGAGRPERIGPTVWQAFYLAVLSGLLAMLAIPFAEPFFLWIGHEGDLPRLEALYFRTLLMAAPLLLAQSAISAFYLGMGRSWLVLGVTAITCLTNGFLNWWFIFHGGPGGTLPMGIEGAAWATNASYVVGVGILGAIFLSGENSRAYATRSGWRLDGALMRRMVRFGFPSGIHSLMDMTAFTTFMLCVGKFGAAAQFASNAAMNLNFLLFVPAFGLHQACQTLAGQAVGAGKPLHAERTTSVALMLSVAYFGITGLAYLLVPEFLIGFYRSPDHTPEVWAEIVAMTKFLLVFVALYSMADAAIMVFAGTIKGAGDVKFAMWATVGLSQLFLTLPCVLIARAAGSIDSQTGLYACYAALTAYIIVAAVMFAVRYRMGAWRRMKVIEDRVIDDEPAATSASAPA